MIKNVIFDMDGVLIDSEHAIQTACAMMFRELGANPRFEDFTGFVGMGENRFIGGVAEIYGMSFRPEMKDRVYEIYAEIADEYIKTYDGIKALIFELRDRGYGLAVASSADDVKVEINLGRIGLRREDFGAVVTGSEVEKKKPDPEVFLVAAQRIGAKPSETLVVEDALSGCEAALAAGMRCVGVTTSFESDKLLMAGACAVIGKTADLAGIIESL